MKAQVQEHLATADLSRTRGYTVAADLGVSLSSMTNKLKLQGVTYGQLVSAERMKRAGELLMANPQADGDDIAAVCGYSHNHAYQALRKWHGKTLRQLQGEALGR